MKITVGIVSTNQYGTPYTDLDVRLEPTPTERNLLTKYGIPIPYENNQAAYSLLKACFSTHGDFFREVGVSNYRTFQPDWSYFRASSSNGWNKFMNRLIVSEDREDILRRVGEIIANKLSLLTNNAPRAVVSADVKKPKPAAKDIQFVDLAGKKLELRVGDKLYVATEVQENAKANTLIKNTVEEVITKANDQVSSFETEYSSNLAMITKQYEEKVKELDAKLKNQLPALEVPYPLMRKGVMVSSPGGEYQIFAPMHLHYKYISTQYLLWEIKKKYQREQDCYLVVAVDGKWNFRWAWIYDKAIKDTIELFHVMGDTLCLGSYKVKLTRLEDILKVAKEFEKLYEVINTKSMSTSNLHTDSSLIIESSIRGGRRINGVYEIVRNGKKRKVEDMDLSEVGRLKTKHVEGSIWSTT